MTKSKLFRTGLAYGTPQGQVTNTTSRSLVIDFVCAPQAGVELEVRAPSGESHVYFFCGVISPPLPGGGQVAILAQLIKLIVKPGEMLALRNPGAAEVTGHYE